MKDKKLFMVHVTDGYNKKFMYVVSSTMDEAVKTVEDYTWKVTSVDILAECTETKDDWRHLLIL